MHNISCGPGIEPVYEWCGREPSRPVHMKVLRAGHLIHGPPRRVTARPESWRRYYKKNVPMHHEGGNCVADGGTNSVWNGTITATLLERGKHNRDNIIGYHQFFWYKTNRLLCIRFARMFLRRYVLPSYIVKHTLNIHLVKDNYSELERMFSD